MFLDEPRVTHTSVSNHYMLGGPESGTPIVARTISVTIEVVVSADDERSARDLLPEMVLALTGRTVTSG